ncbi:MAG: hypothetical protein AB7U76_25040 [Pirellulales bacterium]
MTLNMQEKNQSRVIAEINDGLRRTTAAEASLTTAQTDITALQGNFPVDLTSNVTGTLPVANGGTSLATLNTYELLTGGTSSTGALQQIDAGTSGHLLISAGAGVLPAFGQITVTDAMAGSILYPEVAFYDPCIYVPFACTILSIRTFLASGSLTFALNISGTNVTGCSGSPSTGSVQTWTATANNSVSVGNYVQINVSAASSPVRFDFSIIYTRAVP